MKLLLPIFFAMTGFALAQVEEPKPSQTTPKLADSKAAPISDEQAIVKLIESLKQVVLQAKPLLEAADPELAKQAANAVAELSGQATQTAQPDAAPQKQAQAGLRTGGLRLASIQTGSLPLTLPDAEPTTEPIEQYQMWRKPGIDKAMQDRYEETKTRAKVNTAQ